MRRIKLFTFVFLCLICFQNKVHGAENLSLEIGIFNRKIEVKELEYLTTFGKARGSLRRIISLSKQDPEEIRLLLKEEFALPLVTTSKLMNSSIGEVILLRISEIIYPLRVNDPKVSIPAIRSAVTSGILEGEGTLSIIDFLRLYPNKTITINVPALYKVINKVESISDLIDFFSNSPLKTIKEKKV